MTFLSTMDLFCPNCLINRIQTGFKALQAKNNPDAEKIFSSGDIFYEAVCLPKYHDSSGGTQIFIASTRTS